MQIEVYGRSGGTLAQAGVAADAVAKNLTRHDYLQGRAEETVRAHGGDLACFVRYLEAVGVQGAPCAQALQESAGAWAGATAGLIQGFREWLLAEGYAVKTVNRRLGTVKVFAKLAGIDASVAKSLGRRKGLERDKKRTEEGIATRVGAKKPYKAVSLTMEGANCLRKQPETAQGRRDALLMALLLDHGLRCGEVALLKVEDFDLSAGVMTFYRPKVDKIQRHRLTPAVLEALIAYKPYMPAAGPLLRSSRKGGELTHEGMTNRSITDRVRQLGKRIGIRNLSAHDCRHYWATRATEAGTHPRRLQQAGGWNSPAMVYRYVSEAEIANEGVIL